MVGGIRTFGVVTTPIEAGHVRTVTTIATATRVVAAVTIGSGATLAVTGDGRNDSDVLILLIPINTV